MSITPGRFRLILTLSWTIPLIGSIVDITTEHLLPEPLREYLQAEPRHGFLIWVGVPYLLLVITSYVGLYRFQKWGRGLWLWVIVGGCVVLPAQGPTVGSAWADPFFWIGGVLCGVVLALAYFSSAAEMFEGEPGASPTGGPAASVDNSNAPGGSPSVS